MHATQLCYIYFEKEAVIVYVWMHMHAYMQAQTPNTFNLKGLWWFAS